MRKIGMLLALTVLFALAGCSGSGITSCANLTGIVGSYADCSVSYDQLDGNQTVRFGLGDVAVVLSINAKINVSVNSGAVRFSYTNERGETVSHDVTPSQPLQISDRVEVILIDEVEFKFDANGGIARGVSLSAHFE